MRSFSDVGHQVHPTLTPRANDPEIDGHHQLAEQIRSDGGFIGAAVLGLWRDRLQFDREHRFVPRPWLPTTLVWTKAHVASTALVVFTEHSRRRSHAGSGNAGLDTQRYSAGSSTRPRSVQNGRSNCCHSLTGVFGQELSGR
jgi:hypothetical protein